MVMRANVNVNEFILFFYFLVTYLVRNREEVLHLEKKGLIDSDE